MKFKFFFLIVFIIFLSGCTSQRLTEKNRDDAVRAAQEFIFDNVKNVSPENRKIIMYTYPKILKEQIFLTLGQEFNQYSFAWDLEKPKITILVFGTSKKDFSNWEPKRVIFKEYSPENYKPITESQGVWAAKPSYKDMNFDTTRSNSD